MTALGVIAGVLLLITVVFGGGYFLISYLSAFIGTFGAIIVTIILFILIPELLKIFNK